MCDLITRKSVCHGSKRHWLKPLKLSRWELPVPSSKPYWDGVFTEIERRHKKVKDPYPSFPFPEPSVSSLKTQLSDDIKFKISPPTPMHKTRKYIIKSKDDEFDDELHVINDEQNTSQIFYTNETLKLPSTFSEQIKTNQEINNQKFKKVEIYPKNSCPHHKITSRQKMFNEGGPKYLKKKTYSVPKLPSISKEDKFSCKHRKATRSKSASATLISPSSKEVVHKTITKAPKLSMASLLPSFAKPVSTDSSAGSRESFESEEDSSKVEIQTDAKVETRDFLRVPNLRFASAHPSFRKLSFVDSYGDENIDSQDISVMPSEEFSTAEKNLFSESESIEENEKSSKNEKVMVAIADTKKEVKRKITNNEKRYAYKALDIITKHKHLELNEGIDNSMQKSLSFEESVEPEVTKSKHKKINFQDDDIPIPFQEIHTTLKKKAAKYLNLNQRTKLTNMITHSTTIRSSSRSTSGPSLNFQTSGTLVPLNTVLQKIPEAKIFPRAYFDKCHACLYKPFKCSVKVNRELPLTKLKSIVDVSPIPHVSSSSSSFITEELRDYSFYDSDDEFFFYSPENVRRSSDNDDEKKSRVDGDSKDHLQVSFDKKLLSPSKTDPSSPKDSSPAQTLQLGQHQKDQSLSVQSSDRSKTSTPSNQSSDSEETRGLDDKLPTSKYTAPCHAPVVWRPSLEPLRALKLKKATSLRARAAALLAKSSEGSDSDSYDEARTTDKSQAKEPEKTSEDTKEKVSEKKEKKSKKSLPRVKTAVEKLTSVDDIEIKDAKATKILKRSKTTFDLRRMSDDLSSEESDDEKKVSAKAEDISKKEKREEKLPYFDVILMHRADSPPPPIMSTEDVMRIVKECLDDEFNPIALMEKLANEFTKKIEERLKNINNDEDMKYLKLGLNLLRALIDSRRYLKPATFTSNLEFSHKQSPVVLPSQLKPTPVDSCDISGTSKYGYTDQDAVSGFSSLIYSDSDNESTRSFGMTVHPPTPQKSLVNSDKAYDSDVVNPYVLFLKKPRRKAVVWRPLREEDLKGYDPEATLEMRASRLLDKICKEFCEWLKKLGGDEQIIDEETLKDMFEINFSAEACKSTQVIIREMPTVPVAVARARQCQQAGELEATREQIRRDLEVESRPKRTYAFGRSLPNQLRFVPPRNRISAKWLECKHIPKDLDTMDVVWDGIMHLDSVQAFVQYLKEYPHESNLELLKNLMQRQINVKA